MAIVAIVGLTAMSGAMLTANQRRLGVGRCTTWLLLAGAPIAGLGVSWQYVGQLPVEVALVADGERYFESRTAALSAAPEIEAEWRTRLTRFGRPPESDSVRNYLIWLDPLWDRDQRIRPDASRLFLDRLEKLDAATIAASLDDFATAIGYKPNAAEIATLFSQHDRLFSSNSLQREELKLISARLREIPKLTIEEWGRAFSGKALMIPAVESSYDPSVAMDLVRRDELFLNGHWAPFAFQAMCERNGMKNRAPQ